MNNVKIVINGKRKLCGNVRVSGAKNAALPELAASILSPRPLRFEGAPRVEDVKVMFRALQNLGAEGDFNENTVNLHVPQVKSAMVPEEIVETTRASVLLLGPLLARHGYARVCMPGGCPIGDRKINFHLDGLTHMGAQIEEEGNMFVARAKTPLKAVDYTFPNKTVTGTENLVMAATLADGESILRNCALEPEIGDLIHLLTKMGAEIQGKGTETLIIKGKTSLDGTDHTVIPDRIEMGTYVIAACMADNEILVENTVPEYIDSLLTVLTEIGLEVATWDDKVSARPNGGYQPVNIQTEPFPGYPTDLQAQLTTLLTQVEGVSTIKENIFNNRFQHCLELNKLGANIKLDGDISTIKGKTPLIGHVIRGTDLRASAALVLGGLIAEGQTVIENAYQLLRGYEDMPGKLRQLGADIQLIED